MKQLGIYLAGDMHLLFGIKRVAAVKNSGLFAIS